MSIFFKQAIMDLKQTGALIPSSRFLAAKMTSGIDFNQKLHIVELGAGQGIITRHILSQMNRQSRLTSYEINPYLFNEMDNLNDNRLNVKMNSVMNLPDSFQKDSLDFIISGIPLANMEKETKAQLINICYRTLKPGGSFIQFQYSLQDYQSIKQAFDNIRLGFTLLNLPPAFIYYAQKV
jgi:phosphatidylethanolamine/phosphatidyl-N-methylethanolamine N-methyltransferase